MKTRRLLAIAACLIAALAALKGVHAQIGQPPNDGPPAFLVVGDPDAPAGSQATFDAMAATLNGSPAIPADRINFFAAVINPPNSVITGWQGVVTGVQPNGTGNQVTVLVSPTLTTDTYGPATIITSSQYSEVYQVNADNTFQYLGFLDPQNMAGQPPAEMIGL